jgi:hypothetical protein
VPDPFFRWLESTAFSLWLVESPSLFAFPGILAAHTVGLALLAGPSVAIALHRLGAAPDIPAVSLARLAPLMWGGLTVNLLSGVALVLAYPVKALTNPVFYLKLALIVGCLVMLRRMLTAMRAGAAPEPHDRRLAAALIAGWLLAITAGRLLAYTCSRLTVDLPCS